MKENVRKIRSKAKRLLRLYSLWQETRREDVQQKCVMLLGEILVLEPRFSLRGVFQKAF